MNGDALKPFTAHFIGENFGAIIEPARTTQKLFLVDRRGIVFPATFKDQNSVNSEQTFRHCLSPPTQSVYHPIPAPQGFSIKNPIFFRDGVWTTMEARLLGVEVAVDLYPFGTHNLLKDIFDEVIDIGGDDTGEFFLQFGEGVFFDRTLEFDDDVGVQFHFFLLLIAPTLLVYHNISAPQGFLKNK
jgi:hypothetical protein